MGYVASIVAPGASAAAAAPSRAVGARIGAKGLEGLLAMPEGAPIGLVIFAHGSGSSRFSPRNEIGRAHV